jgi:branched-chain amino acid transport system substrate-binding protein
MRYSKTQGGKAMRKIIVVCVTVIAALSLSACGGSSSSESRDDFFILGIQEPLSGDNAVAGQVSLETAQMFADITNKNGGLLGKQVKLAVYDDQSSSEEAVKVANKLIEVDKAHAVLGSLLSSNVLASARYLNEAKIPTIGIGTSPTWMKQGWEYVFRACMNADNSMPFLIQQMVNFGVKSVGIFKGEDDSSVAGADTFAKMAEAKNIKVTLVASYTTGDTDFSGQIASLLDSKPDTIFMSTQGTVIGSFTKQLRSFGYKDIIYSKEIFTPDQLEVAQASANNYIFATPYITYSSIDDCEEPVMKDFLILFNKTYNKLPIHDCAFRSWDSLLALEAAVKLAGSFDPDAIKGGFAKVKGIEALGGTLDYTFGDREGLRQIKTYTVQDGKCVTVQAWIDAGKYDAYKAGNR